jgi:hypothetical protein
VVLSRPLDPPRTEGGPETGTDAEHGSGAPVTARSTPWLLLVGCFVALCTPLVIAAIGARRPVWTPVLDLAMTELRVRDVGGRHTPLIGLPGRIGTLAEQGSHPGPLSFYALAPVYRLLGSSAWALQVATVVVHAVALGTALVLAARRGGRGLVLGLAVLLAALTAGFGGGTLSEPWNPYLPLLWWVVVLLAVWSVLCGDLVVLPVAVLAASFCAQTHVPYLGLGVGMGALVVVALAVRFARAPDERRRVVRWGLAGAVLGVLLWLPPTIDQVRREPGNYEKLIDHFSEPQGETVGAGRGAEIGLRYLDLAHLAQADVVEPGWLVTDADGHLPSDARGVAVLGLLAVSAWLTWRRGHHARLALHAVVAVGALLGVLAIARIFGPVWYYLLLWGWGIGVLAALAIGWTVADLVADRWSRRRPVLARAATAALVVVGIGLVARFSVDAWNSPHSDATVAAELAAVVPDTVAGLDRGDGLATGRDGRYLVTWSDAFHIGSQGYGLLSELERHGFDTGVHEGLRVPAVAHRVLPTDQATARVHLTTGVHVERWRAVDGATEIAYVDPRSASARREQAALRLEVLATLEDLGLDDLVPRVDDNLFGAAIDQRVPEPTQAKMGRMLEIGAPLAVFVVPVDTPEP